MSRLYLRSEEIKSIFQLLGSQENHISFSVAWALSKCPKFLEKFLSDTIDFNEDIKEVEIRLQEYEGSCGFTDIEIKLKDKFFIIIEAKKGWILPGKDQLEKYAKRKSFINSKAPRNKKCLIVMSECGDEYSRIYLGMDEIKKVTVKNVSWQKMATLASKSLAKSANAEKHLIRELLIYLRRLMTMQKQDTNLVYVVSIGSGTVKGWGISFIDIIEKRSAYFHHMGAKGWPKEPVTYIGFRYHGQLQSIHHVESYEIVENMRTRISEMPNEKWPPHFLYKLGPAIRPQKKVKMGNIYPNGRVWCMLDTLLTCNTISEARDLTKKRLQEKT